MTEKVQKSDSKVHINLTFPPSPPPLPEFMCSKAYHAFLFVGIWVGRVEFKIIRVM